jgi:MoaA/NifB/PqqE/SkfB family radical SAM enzyme
VQIGEPVGKWDGKKDFLIRPDDADHIKKLQLDGPVLKHGQRMINRDIFSGDRDHCPAGTEFMGISCDGNILACNFLQYTLGNIRDVSIKAMREKLLKNRWFSGRHPVCLVGEDDEFIETFVTPYVGKPKPLDAHKIFGLE